MEHVVKQLYNCTVSALFNQTSVAQSSAFPVSIEMSWGNFSLSNLISCEVENSEQCSRKHWHLKRSSHLPVRQWEACYVTWTLPGSYCNLSGVVANWSYKYIHRDSCHDLTTTTTTITTTINSWHLKLINCQLTDCLLMVFLNFFIYFHLTKNMHVVFVFPLVNWIFFNGIQNVTD